MFYSTKEAAKKLDVSENTIRLWKNKLNAPYELKSKKIRFSEAQFQILDQIKTLRDEGAGYEEILEQIDALHDQNMSDEYLEHVEIIDSPVENIEQTSPAHVGLTKEDVRDMVAITIQENNSLAEKYSKATFEVGKLSERCNNLQEAIETREHNIQSLEKQIKLLPDPNDLKYQKEQNQSLSSQLQELEAKISKLRDDTKELKDQLAQKTKKSAQLSEENQALRSEKDTLTDELEKIKKSWWYKSFFKSR